MPRIIVTAAAREGLDRCRRFLIEKNSEAARRAALAISRQFSTIETSPGAGRPYNSNPLLRELLIPFGDSGYVALYIYDHVADEVIVLAFRHQKEAGY